MSILKKSKWLAITAGWLAKLGLAFFLPFVALMVMSLFPLTADQSSEWLASPNDPMHPVWYVIQAAAALGSFFAGGLAALLSPRKSMVVPVALVFLSLLGTAFEQIPRPMSALVFLIWVAGPCIGLILGYVVIRSLERSDLE